MQGYGPKARIVPSSLFLVRLAFRAHGSNVAGRESEHAPEYLMRMYAVRSSHMYHARSLLPYGIPYQKGANYGTAGQPPDQCDAYGTMVLWRKPLEANDAFNACYYNARDKKSEGFICDHQIETDSGTELCLCVIRFIMGSISSCIRKRIQRGVLLCLRIPISP